MDINDIFKERHITHPPHTKPRCTKEGVQYWYKGEVIKLTWDIDGDIKNRETDQFIAADQFMADKTVKITMYNYMGKVVKEWTIENAGTRLEIYIKNDEEKGDYFARDLAVGTYQMAVSIYSKLGLVMELIKRDECVFEVR